jgi:hypothetical protein
MKAGKTMMSAVHWSAALHCVAEAMAMPAGK